MKFSRKALTIVLGLVAAVVAVAFAPMVAHALPALTGFAHLTPSSSGFLCASMLFGMPHPRTIRRSVFARGDRIDTRTRSMLRGAMKYATRASSYPALFQNANVTNASLPEAIPWIYYDCQDFATTWTSVSFFAATQSDKTLSNIEQPNTIAGEQYFMIYAITFDFLMGASTQGSSAAATQLDDARIIMETARATLTMTLAQKMVFRIPLAACHAIGGFQAWVAGTPPNSAVLNSVQNMASDGAWWCDGALILPPRQSFELTVTGSSSALTATRKCRLSLHGVLYRPVR